MKRVFPMKRFKLTVAAIAATALGGASAPAAFAQGDAAAPGISDSEIRIAVIAGFTGLTGSITERGYAGLQTWADEVNDAGGINGRTITLEKFDHKETADGGVAACKEALDSDPFVVSVPEGVEANLTATDCLDEAGVPTLYFAGTTNPEWKRAFSYIPTGAAQGKSLASFVKNKLEGADKKIGVMYENGQAPESGAKAFMKAAKKLKLDIVEEQVVEPTQSSFVPQLQRLQNSGAEVVFLSAVNTSLGIFRDAKQIGYEPQFTGGGFTFDFLSSALKDAVEGVRGLRFGATVDTPAYEKYDALMEKHGRSQSRDKDLEAFLFYGHGLLLGEMLAKAGDNPTRDSFVTGAETIKGFETGILPPITYGPNDHVGADASYPTVCCNSDFTWKKAGQPQAKF
jgi:branched-chain amino acid transport system substrate-binding protein